MDGFVELVAVVMGTSIVLIPVIGLTLRFAIKPAVESIVLALRDTGEHKALGPGPDQRLSLLEDQMSEMSHTLRRLADAHDFDRQLTATTTKSD